MPRCASTCDITGDVREQRQHATCRAVMRHDPKSLLDRLDEPVALAVERERIAGWELFRAREEEVGDLPSRRGCVLLSVPYWDCATLFGFSPSVSDSWHPYLEYRCPN